MSFSDTTAATDLLSVIATVPADDWHRTSIGSRTFIIRMTCKRAKDLFRKTGFPVEVRLSESFWNDPSNGTTRRKLQFIIKKLIPITMSYNITTMDENYYNIRKHLRWLSDKVDKWSDQDTDCSLAEAEILLNIS
jgi:hypothetical protein